MNDTDSQDHYGGEPPKFRSDVQPVELTMAFGLDFLLGNVIKYVCRAGRKGTPLEDLYKARVYLNWEIQRREVERDNL
jgi:hypothetical protein